MNGMDELPRFTLAWNEINKRWQVLDLDGNVLKHYGSKGAALRSGSLKRAIGGRGIVRIVRKDGTYQEVRTFPRVRS